MIFYFNSDGSQVAVTPEKIYQGSNKASTIYFICPTAKTNGVSVAFTLPDGTVSEISQMSLLENFSIPTDTDTVYCWSYHLPSSVTAVFGNVTVQFYISCVDGEVTATASSTFYVERGVPVVEPERGDSYLELLSKIVEIQAKVRDQVIVDEELSNESVNPVQNKVVKEALDGKLGKKTPPQTKNTSYAYGVQRTSSGEIFEVLKEMNASVKADVIPITGSGGTLRVGNPTADAHAVNLGYMNANIGHRYLITLTDRANRENQYYVYYDTKTNVDVITNTAIVDICNEITDKVIPCFMQMADNAPMGAVQFKVASDDGSSVIMNATGYVIKTNRLGDQLETHFFSVISTNVTMSKIY